MIPATEGKEPDYIQDEDLLSLDEMRGAMKDLNKAALTNVEKATVAGCLKEIELLKKMVAESNENNNKLVGLYSTMRNEFQVFKTNHAASLTMRVNGGSTTPED